MIFILQVRLVTTVIARNHSKQRYTRKPGLYVIFPQLPLGSDKNTQYSLMIIDVTPNECRMDIIRAFSRSNGNRDMQ